MTAKPEVVGTIDPQDEFVKMRVSTMDAIAAKLEEQELDLEKLRKQRAGLIASNAVLQERVNEAQLLAAHAIAKSKFSESQMYQRILAVEKDVNDLRNWIQGNCVQRDQEYENLRSSVSYLMGANNP